MTLPNTVAGDGFGPTDTAGQVRRVDVLVVGAGQAGLAAGYHLRSSPCSFVIHDRRARVGDAWRDRYDSLVLFSPRSLSALPGLPLAGDPEGYPGKDEVADYLEHYARAFRLPVVAGEGIARLERAGERFSAHTTLGHRVVAGAVIVAAGAFQEPIVPDFARRLDARVHQLSAATYRRPAQVPPGAVLVVGDGATGRQIARELAPTHEVWLSAGKRRLVVPQRILGRDSMWWLDRAGLLRADRDSFVGRRVRAQDAFPGWHLRLQALRRVGVHVASRTVGAEDTRFRFRDGAERDFDSVVWTLGYRDDTSWIDIPAAVYEAGRIVEDRGVSPVPGLYYVGRSWQNNRASALLRGAGADAAAIVARAVQDLSQESSGVP